MKQPAKKLTGERVYENRFCSCVRGSTRHAHVVGDTEWKCCNCGSVKRPSTCNREPKGK